LKKHKNASISRNVKIFRKKSNSKVKEIQATKLWSFKVPTYTFSSYNVRTRFEVIAIENELPKGNFISIF